MQSKAQTIPERRFAADRPGVLVTTVVLEVAKIPGFPTVRVIDSRGPEKDSLIPCT